MIDNITNKTYNADLFQLLPYAVRDDKLFCFKSYCADAPMLPLPLFFYHTPKAGGTSLVNVIFSASYLYCELTNQSKEFVHNRYDQSFKDQKDPHILKEMTLPYWLLATHQSYGFHESFTQRNYAKVACLRDSLKRVKSAYGYEMMRNDWLPEKDDFHDFICDPKNQNVTLKQFANVYTNDVDSPRLIEEWVDQAVNVLTPFYMVAFAEDLENYLQYYLSNHGLCNVITLALNKTLPQYVPQFSEYDDQIHEKNIGDIMLFNRMQEIKPSLHIDKTRRLSQYYSFVFEQQHQDYGNVTHHYAHESILREALQSGNSYSTLKEFVLAEIMPRNKL